MTEPKPFSREHRKAERARVVRLSRLPFLYDFSLQGRPQAVLATSAQILLAVAVALLLARAVTGRWLPAGVALVALVVALALQALSRYLNARAGRR